MVRKILAYKQYYSEFMAALSEAEQMKIKRSLLLFSDNERIPSHYIKFIRDGVFEFRVSCGKKEFRIFFCYDGDQIVILFNGVVKKSQKLKTSDIEKAVRLRKEYYESKGK